ncbi:TolC family protein [Tenacibaculum singaporense]|uniref:TolC family protein n=1 Tax=Tenacibaculum singaporense TaxID=2358479 RepID=UPI000F68F4D2|nr:TolC family protein [Tenacibaculum singaporense]RSC95191.1 TolC family protein [Tenacibaculum singaporense]
MKTKIALFAAIFTSIAVFSQKQWTLKECVDYALKNNITVKQNRLNVQLAEKDVEISKGNFLPDLNASSSAGFSSGLSPDQTGVLKNTQNFNSSFSLSSRGTIFNGFRNLNQKKQAQLSVKGSELDLAKIENDISLNVVNEYLNVLFAKENLEVATVQAEISKKQIERARAQFEGGVIPKGDLLNVESTAANDVQNVVLQENTLSIALLRLSQLLQIPSKDFDIADIEVGSPSAALLYDNADVVYEKALTAWPDIERAKLDVSNADLNIKLEKGAYLPNLSYSIGASSSYFHQFNNLFPGQSNEYFFKQAKDRIRYNIGLSLNIPIFNRFQTKNRVTKSVINKEVSQLALENQKLQLQQEIESAFLDAKAAAKTYEAAQVSLEAQKEAFKNAQVSYDYGSMTQFDFDQVRNRLVNAEGAMIRAKYDYVFKTKVLKFYYGESIVE